MSAGFADAIALRSPIIHERDARYLAGGNFFGTEAVAPPPLEPLASDLRLEEELPGVARGASGGASIAGGASALVMKLPGASAGGKAAAKRSAAIANI
jgi:hypothetical protein